MDKMQGKLYGIGVGVGNPMDITLRAFDLIKNCDVIFFPNKNKDECVAYKIVRQILPELDSKNLVFCDFPMTKDSEILKRSWKMAADKVCDFLRRGIDVCFLMIGDPSIYSTYFYVDEIVCERGFETCIVSGVTSFCSAAAVLGIPLASMNEQIHIVPSSCEISEALNLDGTLIFMKSGKRLSVLREELMRYSEGKKISVYGVSNCGMENERVYFSAREIDSSSGYLTTVIVKKT